MTGEDVAAVVQKEGWSIDEDGHMTDERGCDPKAFIFPGSPCSERGKVDVQNGNVVSFELDRRAFTPELLSVEEFAQKIVDSYPVQNLQDNPESYMSGGAGIQYNHKYSGIATTGELVQVTGNSWFKNPKIRISGGSASGERFN